MSSGDINKVLSQLSSTVIKDALKELDFSGGGKKWDSCEDVTEVIEAILKCPEMQVLSLGGNSLGIKAAKAIGESLKKHPEFIRAKLSDMFTGRLKTEIPQALRFLGNGIMAAKAQLVELDLSDNAFGPNGMEGLVDFLKSESCWKLRELRLNNNGLGTTGGKMLAKTLMECYEISSKAGSPLALRVFVSGRGRLENEGSIALAEVFKKMGSLEEVSMPQNGIYHKGIAALADAFANSPNLRIINLNDNSFTEKGAKFMAMALPSMQKLELINFGDCLLKTEGALAIAKALQQGHKNLRELNCSANEIRLPGATALCEAMKDKKNLEKLDLNGNQLGDDGIDNVKETVQKNNINDCLGSFSEDEGDDDDDDDDDDDYGDEQQDDDNSEEEDDSKNVDVVVISDDDDEPASNEECLTVTDFISSSSAACLMKIKGNKPSAFLSYLEDNNSDKDNCMGIFMKVCCTMVTENQKAKKIACECADAILKKLFQVEDDLSIYEIGNKFLLYLGLIKSEDKSFKPIEDISGVLIFLSTSVKQSYIPDIFRQILIVFLEKPSKLTEKYILSMHPVLQALHN